MNLKKRVLSYLRVRRAEKLIRTAQIDKKEISFGPSSLNLMMTDTCNSQCIMCGKDYKACGTKEYLSLDDVIKIYGHLDMDHVVDVIYGGGGEPFMNPDLGEIAKHTSVTQPVIQHTVISNFIQWKETIVHSLVDSNVNFLISINAASAEIYKKISGVDAYDAVTEHVKRLVAISKKHSKTVKISISMILMRQNIEELPAFIRLAAALGVDDVKTLYVRVYPDEYRQKTSDVKPILPQDSLFYHQDICRSMIAEAARLAKQLRIDFEHEPLFTSNKNCARSCKEPWKSLFVNFDGDVYPCPASEILFKSKVDSSVYRSGNILKQHVDEFWNNSFWQVLRETNREKERKEIIHECQCCGNSMNWFGPGKEKSHIMDWRKAKQNQTPQ